MTSDTFYLGELLRTLEEERFLRPRAGTWALGDRELVCVVESGDGTPLTGSVAFSGM